jgi:hypothetical protein
MIAYSDTWIGKAGTLSWGSNILHGITEKN